MTRIILATGAIICVIVQLIKLILDYLSTGKFDPDGFITTVIFATALLTFYFSILP